jgi:hypothetical protein
MPDINFTCNKCGRKCSRHHNARKCSRCGGNLIPAGVPPTGVDLIARERMRQITEEGWDTGHDLEHGATTKKTNRHCEMLT